MELDTSGQRLPSRGLTFWTYSASRRRTN